jgi:anti-sigma regulatory factor (Ser/Thr protein kinase)
VTPGIGTGPADPGVPSVPRLLASFTLPSEPGSERAAVDAVARSLADTRLTSGQRDRLITAVGEATMNAVEHGNGGRPDLPVDVEVVQTAREVVVSVTDRGGHGDGGGSDAGFEDRVETPDLAKKLNGEQSPRGWGLFLIRSMIDAMDVTTDGERHTVRLVMRTGRASDTETEST